MLSCIPHSRFDPIIIFVLLLSLCEGANKIDPLINIMSKDKNIYHNVSNYNFITKVDLINNEQVINVIIKTNGDTGNINNIKGIKINSVVKNIITASLPLSSIGDLSDLSNVIYIEAAKKCKLFLDASLPSALISPIKTTYKYDGSGVIVGDVDSGIDFTHKDFRNTDGTTRIKFIWDQTLTKTGNESTPTNFAYGVEYTQTQIDAHLSGSGNVREQDTEGHGTHVSGIAAGNGNATGNGQPANTYVGVASKSNIIMVKSDLYDDHIIDGVNYIMQKANLLNMPAVVNLSLGNDTGPHDGTSTFDTGMDNLVSPGKLIVSAAGNSGGADSKIHHSGTIESGVTKDVKFNVYQNTEYHNLVYLDMWYKGGDNISVQLIKDSVMIPNLPLQPGGTIATNTGVGSIIIDATANPSLLNGDKNIIIQITETTIGEWTLRLKGESMFASGKYDIWSYWDVLADFPDFSREMTLNSPGTAKKVITVGSYTTKTSWVDVNSTTQSIDGENIGGVSSFSSWGPTRDGREKPEILAPGCMIVSSLSSQYSPYYKDIVRDECHVVNAGTSMSSPHIAGLVALMLQKYSSLDVETVRNALTSTGTMGSYNKQYGYGNVRGLSAFDALSKGIEKGTISDFHCYPNPVRGDYVTISYNTGFNGDTIINIYNIAGEIVSTATNYVSTGLNKYIYNVHGISPGIYFYQVVGSENNIKSKKMKMAIIK
ncbi:MAG: S8 family serine peptidase [Candidatus Firestonebacteria bacterium]